MEITIPTSLKEINCYQWKQLENAIDTIENAPLLKITVISILCRIPLKDVAKFKMNDIAEIYNQLNQTLEQKPNIEHFTIDGIKYGFIPNLEEISGAEYIDAETYLNTDIFKFMAVVYRPIKKEIKDSYKIEKYKGSEHLEAKMVNAPASAYVSAKLFFLTLLTDLLNVTKDFTLKSLTTSEVALLEKNGVGISQLTNLLEEIGLNSKEWLQN